MMERIVLEVDSQVAKKWRNASFKLRSQLNRSVGKQIEDMLDKSEPEDTIRFFDELREEMSEKGLTREVLDNILDEED